MPRFLGAGKGCVRHEASRPSIVETPNTAGEIMTKDVLSVLVGSSVRDLAILLLEKRISAVPVLAANLELLGMVSEGDLMGHSDTDRVARRDWWLTLLKDFQPQTETIAALAARPVEQVMRAPVLTIEARAPSRATPARTSPLISASVSTRSKTIATRSAESPYRRGSEQKTNPRECHCRRDPHDHLRGPIGAR
jgi:CBS domain-containing protein